MSPFAPCSSLLILIPGKPPELLLAESEALDPVPSGLVVSRFPGYTFREPTDTQAALCTCVIEQLRGISSPVVAVETAHFPTTLLLALERAIPQLRVVDLSAELASMRAIKDPAEIQILREAVRLTDVGQSAAREAATGRHQRIELFAEIRRSDGAGGRGTSADICRPDLGSRSAEAGGLPGNRILREGEMVIVDLAPRYRGMSGAIPANACDRPASRHRTGYWIRLQKSGRPHRAGGPGVKACDLGRFGRAKIAASWWTYEHHTGHGLGASWHEEPRIVPYNTLELKPGMVLALEPAIYFGGSLRVRLNR